MSHPPPRYQHFDSFSSTSPSEITRRRRHHHVDVGEQEGSSLVVNPQNYPPIVGFANRRLNPSPFKERQERRGSPSISLAAPSTASSPPSYSNLTSLLEPANQLWNTTQNSLTSFVGQYATTQPFPQANEEEENPPSEEDCSLPDHTSLLPAMVAEMPFGDRTGEFRTISKSCQLRLQANGPIRQNKEERDRMLSSSIQFNQLARRIGRDLSLTCGKLERLAQLAKKRSLFDDRPEEVEELSLSIKQDISGLTRQLGGLQTAANERSATAGAHKEHSRSVVQGLTTKLTSVGKAFQDMLELRTQNQKLKKTRRERFSKPVAVPTSLPPPAAVGMNGGSLLLYDDAMAHGSSSSTAVDMDQIEQHRMSEQLTLAGESDTYHRDRYNAVENIESSISDLGTIFRQLASLVSEQGEMITRIDSNVDETSMNVEAAHHELLRYFNSISRNRWLMIKVFGVLALFFVFFVIFMT